MTLIVASLFLPYTVEFEVRQEGGIEPAATAQANPDASGSNSALAPEGLPRRPPFSKQASGVANSTSILKTMAKKAQAQAQAGSPEMYASMNSTRTHLPLSEDELSKASVEDFFYHHPKLRRSSTASPAQYSSGTATPLDQEGADRLAALSAQQHNALLRTALGSASYIQPRARTPPVMNTSAVVEPVRKELQTPGLKVIPRIKSATNLANRSQPSYTTKSLYSLASRKEFSSSEHIPGASYEAVYDDSGIGHDPNGTDPVHMAYDIPDKIAPYGGFSDPGKAHRFGTDRTEFFTTAPFEVVSARRGNVSMTKAVAGAAAQGLLHDRGTTAGTAGTAGSAGTRGDVLWVGTVGMPSDEVPASTRARISSRLRDDYAAQAVFVDDITFQGHYKSFCKQILWPSLHYQIPDNPKSKVFEEHSWKYYKAVNETFAQALVDTYKDGDVIWIHDYHLLLVPQMVRARVPNAKIGLFLHVSFPSSEVFRCFAQRNSLLEGMLGANVISFQTEEYVRHFVQTCNRLLLSDYTTDGIKYDGRTIKINHIPVGIDAGSLRATLDSSEEIQYWKKLIQQRWPNKKLIVTRDKVDRIRGIKQKLLAYEKFLAKNPEYLDEVILIQICLPTNDHDEDLESGIGQIVDRINSRSNNISIAQPVVFLNQDIDFEQYLALLTEADTFIVSTMREGMNLTCHEFIVSTFDKHSPLILSEFTGSASILHRGAILINPWDIRQFAAAIEQAIKMPAREKTDNWRFLHDLICKQDSTHWVTACVDSILASWDDQHGKTVASTCTKDGFFVKYNGCTASKRVFLFNLENLTSTVQYENSKLNTVEMSRIFNTLNNITSDPRNVVYVMSYLKKSDLVMQFRQVSNLGLIAENGGYVKLHDSNTWYSLIDEEISWKPAVVEYVNSIVERLPHSSVEIEDCTVRFHTEKVRAEDAERKMTLTGELITHINDVFANQNVHATWFNEVVVIQQVDLPRQALQLISYSVDNKTKLDSDYKNVPLSPGAPMSVVYDASTPAAASEDRIGLLCVIGGQSPSDESLFAYAAELEANGKVSDLLSIEVGKVKRSLANQYVGGVNELFNILKAV